VYYKDVKSFIVDKAGGGAIPDSVADTAECPVHADRYDEPVQLPVHHQPALQRWGGKIKGVELALTQPIWRGFGVQANYTYSDASLR